MLQLLTKLVLKLAPPNRRPARAIPQRVARLDHELRDHAVEDDALEVRAPGVADEVLDRLRRVLGEEADVDVAERGVDGGGVGEGGGTGGRGGGGGGGDVLHLAGRALVEDVAFAGFLVSGRGRWSAA